MKQKLICSFFVLVLLMSGLTSFAQTDTTNHDQIGVTNPSNITEEVQFDESNNQYIVLKKVGNILLSTDYYSAEDYRKKMLNQSALDYWREKEKSRAGGNDANSLIPPINIKNELFKGIFGSNKIEIRPQGSAELILGVRVNKTENPNIPLQQRTVTTFNFDQNIQLNVLGKIGDKIQLNANFNTKALFNFENQMNLKYEGGEDDILQLLEFGNVSLPLTGTLIQGSQSLFGVKNKLKFGKLEITSIFTQQQGQKQNITVEGGAQITKFEVSCANYEANRHYFLGDYFMHQYDNANKTLPYVTSPVYITRIEVWVTNRINATENVRNIVAILPLGESLPNTNIFPQNEGSTYNPQSLPPSIRDITSQTLFNQLQNGLEIEKLANARLLNANEFSFDPYLGYISLNQSLNADEVLAVAFQYTAGGKTYQVGEFGTDLQAPNALVVKLLKASNFDVTKPNFPWMMKNIYSIGGYNIGQDDFTLNILYQDTETGVKVNYFPNATGVSGIPLIRLFNLDRLNQQNDLVFDGFFDFIEGRTIKAQNGRIIFPVREPFSKTYLSNVFQEANAANPIFNPEEYADRYAFDTLYKVQQQLAELNQEKNRFYIAGSYKGASGSEISLNAFNVPQGSVTVTAGGQTLSENVDYTVDYAAGRVRIINESILNSGLPINISLENNATFNIQQKRLIGTHIDYKFNKNFQIGGTIMNLQERPLTQKVDLGNEPVDNTIWGFDVNYSTTSNFITRLVDKIPGINTKAPSQILLNGEFAHMIPGYNPVIDQNGENGVSYVDDFEGAETPIDIRNPFMWKLGSVPEGNPRFPNGDVFNNLQYNFNRARLSWFTMDPLFYRFNTLTPQAIKDNPTVMTNNYIREVQVTEVFPGYQPPLQQGIQPQQLVLDMHYYPDERGPYNYDVNNFDESFLDKLKLKNPKTNFGSMMRRMETTDWDAANVSYIEFWMMDPFDENDLNLLKEWEDGVGSINQNTTGDGGGDFIIQIGNMNEDILKDGRMSFENGMPTPTDPNRPLINTAWGKVPLLQPINQNFDNDPATRELQDIGYDGLNDVDEKDFFTNFISDVQNKFGGPGNAVFDSIAADPSGDNFSHYNAESFNSVSGFVPGFNYPHSRYKKFIGPEKNSPASNINFSYGQVPNTEDVNNNFTLDKPEGYYQYSVSLRPGDLNTIGENFITDILNTTVPVNINGQIQNKNVKWIQFRIPVRTEDKEQFGTINDFRSIRFMRMLLQGFPDDIYVRLATLQLVRADWRTYTSELWDPDAFITPNASSFNSTTVNIEENTRKEPFPYALPPGITREIDPANPQLQQLNEQSLVLNVNGLQDGEAKGVYKNTQYDMRAYKYLKMFVHEEQVLNNPLDSHDLTLFVRLGMDASENYYEVEVPLTPSDPSIQPVDPNPNDQIPNDDPVYKRNLWLAQNNLVIDLQSLPDLKLKRNSLGLPSNLPFQDTVDGRRITVVGNPNIANVRSMMIGVRNPHQKHNPWQTGANGTKKDDGQSKTAQVWVNELRLTDYFEAGGWAAKARGQVNLADFGQVSMAVSHTTFGFGNIDQKPQQRSRNNTSTFDVTTSFELGKFFGSKSGVTIPLFFGYSTKVDDPQFNPLDPDVLFRDALDVLPTDQARDSLKQMSQTLGTKTTFNITNMKKTRTDNKRKPKIWDIENWDASYSYVKETFRDIRTEYNNTTEQRASLGYTFTPQPQPWEPFKKSKGLKSKWLKWVKDFNFTWSPKRLAFRANIVRDVNEFLLRNTTDYPLLIIPTSRKNFTWTRTYEFQYSPFKSLNFTFSANNSSRIDEPEMKLDSSVTPRVQFFGRNTGYTHNWDVSYSLPLSKIPLTDWITASIGYSGNYKWTAGNMERNPNGDFTMGRWGNIAQNANTLKGNLQLNMTTLYNKIPWIKDLNKAKGGQKKEATKQGAGGKKPEEKKKEGEEDEEEEKEKVKIKIVKWEKAGVNFKAGRKKLFKHNLKTEDVTFKVTTPDGKEIKGETQVVDKKKARFIASEDAKDAMVVIEGKIEKKPFRWLVIPETIARIVTGFKNFSVSYNESNGTTLPGYKAGTTLLGMDMYNPSLGFDFVMGRQFSDVDLVNNVVKNAWLIRDSTMNVLFMRTHSSNLTANATYEPFKGFRVTFTANRTYVENFQSNYRYIPSVGDFISQNPLSMGNFSMSYMMIGTSFGGEGQNFSSRWFNNMLNSRSVISNRLALLNPNANPVNGSLYQSGYQETQQDVLMYSFLSAYTGGDPGSMELNPFPMIPIPNWRIQFDGLKDIPFIKKVMKNIVLSHAYQSTYSLAGFQSNYVYNDKNPQDWLNNPWDQTLRDDNGNFISRYFLNSISLVESYNPLIKIDMTFNNSLTANVEIKSSRNISLNFPNQQITENNTFEIIAGAGYIIKDVKLPFRIGGKEIKNNLNIRFDFGLKDNSTVIRKISPVVEQVTAGQRAITIKGFAEYTINTSLSVRLFVDQIINNPFVANQFPTANTNAGLSVRFTLTQ